MDLYATSLEADLRLTSQVSKFKNQKSQFGFGGGGGLDWAKNPGHSWPSLSPDSCTLSLTLSGCLSSRCRVCPPWQPCWSWTWTRSKPSSVSPTCSTDPVSWLFAEWTTSWYVRMSVFLYRWGPSLAWFILKPVLSICRCSGILQPTRCFSRRLFLVSSFTFNLQVWLLISTSWTGESHKDHRPQVQLATRELRQKLLA